MRPWFLMFLFTFVVAVGRAADSAPAGIDQSTALGQIELATRSRGTDRSGENAFLVHGRNYADSNGGPRLAATGLQLGRIIRSPLYAGAMSVLMSIFVGLSIVRAMKETGGSKLPDLLVSLGFKFLIGVFVFHFPGYVYAAGMTVRDLGMTLAHMAFVQPQVKPGIEKAATTTTPATLDFDRTRAMAIDRAIQDHAQPMKMEGAPVSAQLYNQFVNYTQTFDNSGAPPERIPYILVDAAPMQKSRMMDENISKVVQLLAKDPSSTLTFKAYRIGLRGLPDTRTRSWGPLFDFTSGETQGVPAAIPEARITIRILSLSQELKEVEQSRANFVQKAKAGQFESADDYEKSLADTLMNYDTAIYTKTSDFIKKTFWYNLAFACGDIGGNDWAYTAKRYSTAEIQQISGYQKELGIWYDNTTKRVGASYSVSKPPDLAANQHAGTVIKTMAFIRDAVITRLGTMFFDVVTELYVFIMWLVFPLWFFPATAKAFTGAFQVLVMACLTPATFTAIFVIWDALIGFAMGNGGGLGIVATLFSPLTVIFWGVVYIFGCVVFLFLSPKICKSILSGTSVVGSMVAGVATAVSGAGMAAANPTSLLGKVGQSVASTLGGSLSGAVASGSTGSGAPPAGAGTLLGKAMSSAAGRIHSPDAELATAGHVVGKKSTNGGSGGMMQQLAGSLVHRSPGASILASGALAALGTSGGAGSLLSSVVGKAGALSSMPGVAKQLTRSEQFPASLAGKALKAAAKVQQ